MESQTTSIAAAEPPVNAGILQTLGIDVKILIFQVIGFLVLVLVLKKFVYPVLMKAVDARHAANEAGLLAAQEAEAKATRASQEIDEAMVAARAEARDAVATAKNEAAAIISTAEQKAQDKSARIIADGRDQIQKDILAAKRELNNETIDLITLATEKVIGKTLTRDHDTNITKSALTDAKTELGRG